MLWNSNNTQVNITDSISKLDSNVLGISAQKKGNNISVSIIFNPYKDSFELISGLPLPTIDGYYIPVFNYSSGKPINGGLWLGDNGKVSYYGDISTSSHIAHFEYVTK